MSRSRSFPPSTLRSWPPSGAGLARGCLLGLVLSATGCLDHEPYAGNEAEQFIALQRDFAEFRSWESYDLGDAAIEPNGHPSGPRRVYINRLPDPGSKRFPTGTMIVKTRGDGAPSTWEVHGMAKRGGDFNAAGALGWEWFDLRISTSDEVAVVWRGTAPPAGHGYRTEGAETVGATTGDCNACHLDARANDFVMTPHLRLSEL